MENNYSNVELRTIYFALVDRLQENKKEFEKTKNIDLVDYMEYLNRLIEKTQNMIDYTQV